MAVTALAASAGPIEWSYSARVRTKTGTGVLHIGEERLAYDPSGNGSVEPVFADYVFSTAFPERTTAGDFLDGGTAGDTPIPLFHVPPFPSRLDVVPAPVATPMDSSLLLTFILTDRTSGETGSVDFEGHVSHSSSGLYPATVLYSLDLGPATRELILGTNRYTVRGIGGLPDEIDEPATGGVQVTAAPAVQTPEPGTLVMAGLGIGALGLLRRSRNV